MFGAWGRVVHRFRWLVLAASLVLLLLSGLAFTQAGTLTNESRASVEASRANDSVQAQLPHSGGSSFLVLFENGRLSASDASYRSALESAVAPLRADPRVSLVRTPYDVPPAQAAGLLSRDGHKALAIVSVKQEFAQARKEYPELRSKVNSDVLSVTGTGNLAINRDFDRFLEADLTRAEVVSIPVSALLLLLVFGALVAALLPVGVGILAVVGGLAGVFLLARFTDVSQYALNIVTLIGLGVAIDYSLLIVNRHREELARGASGAGALETTMATAGRAITFSGITVAIGLSGMFFYRGTFLASMGVAGALVVGVAVFYALTFLPALLAILGHHADAIPVLPIRLRSPRGGQGAWHRIASAVMRRPVLVLVPALLFILAVGSPFLHLRLANGDQTQLPQKAESRRGYDQLLKEFPGFDQTTLTAVVTYPDGSPLTSRRVGELYDYSRRLARIPDVLRVDSPVDLDPALGRSDYQSMLTRSPSELPPPVREAVVQDVGRRIFVLNIRTAQPGQSDAARAILRAVRADRMVGDGRVEVTGQTAFDVDYINLILSDTPVALVFVVVVTYLVLFLLLGSVVLPLKAVLTNLLSISASFGALVWIFQDGHFRSLLGFSPTSIDPTLPVILFCIVFGLSMDYEVFLLTRIQEEYRRTGDNRSAVADGLERSGRLITGAAAIMVAVFLAFALADVVLIKSIGLGLALAVLIDATIVRALIVPAVMRLLGDLNWWAPDPLARLYRWLGLGEGTRSVGKRAIEGVR